MKDERKMIYFSSDSHLSHYNIIKYCNRPFASIAEMNDTIINNFNSVIKPKDTLYFLGDFCFSKQYDYILSMMNRLNGNKICIIGNHDRREFFEHMVLDGTIDSVHDVLGVNINKRFIWMSHYSHRVWPHSHQESWHLFGHTHNTVQPYGLSFDCGVDGHNFFPWSFDEVAERMAKQLIERKNEIIRKQ